VGVVGLFDVAGTKKITYAKKDFGQTLGKYGVGSGPFLIIPVLGPNNLRDFSGFVVERAVSPLAIDFFQINGKKELISDYSLYSLTTLSLLDTREGLIEIVEDVRVNSFDVYATMRSAYMQRRHSLILNK
jgi:phospholipid-binding lipoprotein MlaA